MKKRDVMLVDDSLKQIRMTLWERSAEEFDASGSPVCAFRGARVSDYGGRALSVGAGSAIKVNPDIPEANKLKHWYASQPADASYQTFAQSGAPVGSRSSSRITLDQVKRDGLGSGDQVKLLLIFCADFEG